jgi:hypothetical protein
MVENFSSFVIAICVSDYQAFFFYQVHRARHIVCEWPVVLH